MKKKGNKKIKVLFKKIFHKMNIIIIKLSGVLYFLVILLIIFISSQALSFCVVYFQVLSEGKVNNFLFSYINIWNIIYEKFSQEVIRENVNEIKIKIEFLMNMAIALSGCSLSILTLISYLKKNINDKNMSSFKKVEIINDGDDINLMCQYYDNADFVCIYSNTFNWVIQNNEAEKMLSDLAQNDKLKLYTCGNISNVQKLFSLYPELFKCLKQAKTKSSLRFSYIERDNAKYILYRQEAEEHTYIILVREKYESKYLIEVISQLVKE